MALGQQQKSEIRRHLKYGNIGLSSNTAGSGTLGANTSIYSFDHFGELEVRLNSLTPIDCAAITGSPSAVVQLQGPDPNQGDELSIIFSGGNLSAPVTISYTALANQNRTQFTLQIAALCAQSAPLANAGIQPFFPYDKQDVDQESMQNITSEIDFVSPVTFLLTIGSASGNIGASLPANGSVLPNPQTVLNKVNYVGYLPVLNALYGLIFTSSDRLAVDKADVFTARKTEVKERRALYRMVVEDLANFLEIPINPNAPAGNRSNQCHL